MTPHAPQIHAFHTDVLRSKTYTTCSRDSYGKPTYAVSLARSRRRTPPDGDVVVRRRSPLAGRRRVPCQASVRESRELRVDASQTR